MSKSITLKSAVPAFLLAAAAMCSCTKQQVAGQVSEGMARISLQINSADGFATRSLDESLYRDAANYHVYISAASSGELLHHYNPGEVPSYVELPFATYTIKASMGAEHPASRSEFLSTGETTVSFHSGEHRTVAVSCAPTCGKVMVDFDPAMGDYFSDYHVTFSTPELGGSEAMWARDDSEPWYLAVGADGSKVTATIHLVARPEYDINKTYTDGVSAEGTVVRSKVLSRNKAWTLKIAPNYSSSIGQLGIEVTIDDSTEDHEVNIEIPSEWK